MLSFHMIFPTLLLFTCWRGRMKYLITLKEDMPVFVVIGGFHLADIFFTLAGGYVEVLWLVILASVIHWVLLGWIYAAGRKVKVPNEGFIYGV